MSSAVVDITVERTRAVTVTFEDGAVGEFPLRQLRESCPCAACRGRRDAGQAAWDGRGDLAISDAELVGAWGLSIEWHDGHNTGIYPWTSLRRWHEEDAHGVVAE